MLNIVKKCAKDLLHLDPIADKELPFIIYHPFIDSNPFYYYDTDKKHLELFDIFEDKEKYNQMISQREKWIDEEKSFSKLCMMINKPYRLFFLYLNQDNITKDEFAKQLKQIWIDTEFPNADKNVSVHELLKMFHKADINYLMTTKEKEMLDNLPEQVKIYRGSFRDNNYNALSWTLDYDKAHWFATRFDKEGYVFEAMIDKKNIIAYFNDRNEDEVIIDFHKIKNMNIEKVFKIDI